MIVNRKIKRGFASVMAGTILMSQILTPSLSNLAKAEDLVESENPTEVVESSADTGRLTVEDGGEPTTNSDTVVNNEDKGVDEKTEVSDDFTPMPKMGESVRHSALANVEKAAEADSTSAGGNNIERFSIEWRTKDNDNDAAKLHNVWTDNEEKSVSYKMTYALSGQKDYAIGTVNIKVPKTIFKDRNNKPIGYTEFGVPKAPDNNGYFAYTEVEDGYLITNTKRLTAASSGVIEATIKGLIPTEIKDFASRYQSDLLQAELKVTVQGGLMGLSSNRIYSNIDTSTRVYDAYLRHNTEVYTTFPRDWDPRLRPSNPDDYYYATFTSYANTQANQPFNANLRVDMRASNDARGAIVLGVKNARKNEVLLGNGTGVFDREIEHGVYLPDGQNFANLIYVAYPKTDFRAVRGYELKGTVDYRLTGLDDNGVTNARQEATLPFSPVKSDRPDGSFYVEKQGDGDFTTWVDPLKREGIYDTALNKLKARQNVDVRYDIQTRAYGGAFTLRDGGDPEKLSDYGRKPYKLVTDDFKTTFNDRDEELSSSDFEIKGIDLGRKPFARKFVPLEDSELFDNVYARKVFTAGNINKPLFGYAREADSNLPLVDIYGRVSNGNWVKYGVVNYRTGVAVITPSNGASVEGSVLRFPQNVTDFKTEAETTIAHYVHDIYEIVTIKPSSKILSQIDELYRSGLAPKTYLANHIKLDVYREGRHYGFINEYVGRNQLHGFAYGIKPEKTLVEYKNDTSKKKVDLTYELSGLIQTNLLTEDSVKRAVADGWYREQTEGVFYDLLPEGVLPITTSIEPVRDGDSVTSVKATENYKGSGRILLEIKMKLKPDYKYQYRGEDSILHTKGFYDKPAVRFKARMSWLNLKSYGALLPNIMAYGSKSAIEGVRGLETESNPTTGKNSFTSLAFKNDKEKELMKGLNFDGTRNFVYARKDSELVVDTSSVTSVLKEVDVNNEGLYGDGLDESLAKNVYEGGRYNYAISMKNTDVTKAKDIIFYDNLEKFKPLAVHDDYGDTTWHGTFQNINLDALRKAGVEPVVYYSTRDNLVLDNDSNRRDMDLNNSSIWSRTMPSDKSRIKAIAIDARRKADGSEFILPASGSLSAVIEMKAPTAPTSEWYDKVLSRGQKETGLTGGAHAYNNVVMTSRQIAVNTGAVSDNLLVRHDYVKVGLKPFSIKIKKSWDDDDNRDGLRGKSAVFKLVANGVVTNKTVTLNEGNQWSGEFTQVPYSDSTGFPINYTVVENPMRGYNLDIKEVETTDTGVVYKVANRHEPETVDVSGKKTWLDSDVSKRPKSIEVVLKADGNELHRQVVTPDKDEWKYSFKNLHKYRDGGTLINYTIEEKTYVPGYATEVKGYDITNKYSPYADVVLRKEVENQTAEARRVNPDFKFIFNLVDLEDRPVMKEYAYETTLGRRGKVTNGQEFTLKGGEEVKIKNVDSEHKVTFKEVDYPSGYKLVNEVNSSETLRAGSTMRAVFTNRYESKGSVNLDVNKELTGRTLSPYEFRFSLYKDNELIRVGTNDANGKVNFGLLEFTQGDLGKRHTYKIREDNLGSGGISYDNHEETVTVDLTDDGRGNISPRVNYDRDGARFRNTYRATGSVNFKAWKQMVNGFKPNANQFSFELVDSQNRVVATGKNDEVGTINFSGVNFTERDAGRTYTYTAREVRGNDNSVDYDGSTVTFTVTITDNMDGTLGFNTTARDNKVDDIRNDVNSPVFVNKYKDGKLTIRKRVTRGNPNEEFRFKVKLKGVEGTVPKGNIRVDRRALDNASRQDAESRQPSLWSRVSEAISFVFNVLEPKVAQAAETYSPSGRVIATGVDGVPWELYENGYLLFKPESGKDTLSNFDETNQDVGGDSWKRLHGSKIKYVGFSGKVYAPSLSSYLFSSRSRNQKGFEFNPISIDTSKIDTSRVTDMDSMFQGASNLTNLDLSRWDTSNVTNMRSLFRDTTSLTTLNISRWDTSKVTLMSDMFSNSSSLISLDLSRWDVRNVVSTAWMFSGARKLTTVGDISNWRLNKLNNMKAMFKDAASLTSLDLSRWDVSKVTDLSDVFNGASSLTTLRVDGWDTSKVTNMRSLFYGVVGVNSLDVSRWDVRKVQDMSWIFSSSGLTSLDLDSWSTDSLTALQNAFYNMPNLTSLKVRNFNTRQVTVLRGVFRELRNLRTLDINTWDVTNVEDMTLMFSASGLDALDLSRWQPNKLRELSWTFADMPNLTTLDVSRWNFGTITNLYSAFHSTSEIKKIKLPMSSSRSLVSGVTRITDTLEGYTDKWIREDKAYGPMTWDSMVNSWQPAMAGTWVREVDDPTYNITYNTSGTGESITGVKARVGDVVNLPTPTVRKQGTKFKGWSKTSNGTILTAPVRNLANKGETVTLYAVWETLDNNINVSNGEFEITVMGNEEVTIPNLAAGMSYEVYELSKDGWVLVDENSTVGDIKPNTTSVASFTNEYIPNTAQAKIQAIKTLDRRVIGTKGFRFELVKGNTVVETVESNDRGVIDFKTLRFNTDGVYDYKIREVNTNRVGINYDTSVKNVRVNVREVGGKRVADVTYDGSTDVPRFNNTTQTTSLEISKVVEGTNTADKDFKFKVTINGTPQEFMLRNGGKKVITDLKIGDTWGVEEIDLPVGYRLLDITNRTGVIKNTQPIKVLAVNKYTPTGSFEIAAKKVLNGKDLVSGQFTFQLLDAQNNVIDTVKNDAQGNIHFNSIPLKKAGFTSYQIKEVRGTEAGITYDGHIEYVRVTTTDNGRGQLQANVVYDRDGAVFTNTYTPPSVPSTVAKGDVAITKKVEGTTTTKDFKVKVEITKDGKVLDNRFNYTSSRAGKTGTIASGEKFDIRGDETITIAGVPQGATVRVIEDTYAGYRVKNDSVLEKVVGSSNNNLTITNVYEAHGDLLLSGTKRLVGANLKDYRFTFMILQNGKILQELTNDAQGNLHFVPLYYTNKDIGKTYEYEVIEDSGFSDRINYDKTVYKVKVAIADNGDGTLRITKTMSGGNNIQFTNTLRPDYPITGTDSTVLVLSSLVGLVLVGRLRRKTR